MPNFTPVNFCLVTCVLGVDKYLDDFQLGMQAIVGKETRYTKYIKFEKWLHETLNPIFMKNAYIDPYAKNIVDRFREIMFDKYQYSEEQQVRLITPKEQLKKRNMRNKVASRSVDLD